MQLGSTVDWKTWSSFVELSKHITENESAKNQDSNLLFVKKCMHAKFSSTLNKLMFNFLASVFLPSSVKTPVKRKMYRKRQHCWIQSILTTINREDTMKLKQRVEIYAIFSSSSVKSVGFVNNGFCSLSSFIYSLKFHSTIYNEEMKEAWECSSSLCSFFLVQQLCWMAFMMYVIRTIKICRRTCLLIQTVLFSGTLSVSQRYYSVLVKLAMQHVNKIWCFIESKKFSLLLSVAFYSFKIWS